MYVARRFSAPPERIPMSVPIHRGTGSYLYPMHLQPPPTGTPQAGSGQHLLFAPISRRVHTYVVVYSSSLGGVKQVDIQKYLLPSAFVIPPRFQRNPPLKACDVDYQNVIAGAQKMAVIFVISVL